MFLTFLSSLFTSSPFHVSYEVHSQSEERGKKDERQQYLRDEERFIYRIVIIDVLVYREKQQSQVSDNYPELGKEIIPPASKKPLPIYALGSKSIASPAKRHESSRTIVNMRQEKGNVNC